MLRSLLKLAAKGAVGFVIALTVWLALSGPYTRFLAAASQGVIRLIEWRAATFITPQGTLMVVERSDIPPPRSGRLAVESTNITFNFILLASLFAASNRALADRNVFGFVGAAVGLAFVHVAAVVAYVKAYFAVSFGKWSALNYGVVARSVWSTAPFFYSVIGVYAFAFGLWWIFRAPPEPSSQALPRGKNRRR